MVFSMSKWTISCFFLFFFKGGGQKACQGQDGLCIFSNAKKQMEKLRSEKVLHRGRGVKSYLGNAHMETTYFKKGSPKRDDDDT